MNLKSYLWLVFLSITLSTMGCADEERATNDLPGTWTGDASEMVLSQEGTTPEVKRTIRDLPEDEKPTITAIYRSDGTFKITMAMMGREQVASGTWEIVEQQSDSIKIETVGSNGINKAEVTFVYLGPNKVRMTNSDRPGTVILNRLVTVQANQEKYGAESPRELLKAIDEAVESKSKEDFIRLSCWKRLTQRLRERFNLTTPFFTRLEVTSTRLVPEGDDPYVRDEFRYNIDYKGYVEINYKGMPVPLKLPYGSLDGRYYLATMLKNETYEALSAEAENRPNKSE